MSFLVCVSGTYLTFHLFFSQLIAVFDEQDVSNKTDDASIIAERLSSDPYETELSSQHQPLRGEIEVTPSALKLGMPFSILHTVVTWLIILKKVLCSMNGHCKMLRYFSE